MDSTFLQEKYNILSKRFVIAVVLLSLSIIGNAGLAISLNAKDQPRIVLIPSDLKGESYISDKGYADNYVAALAQQAALTLLNATPDSLDFRREALLQLAHPKYHGSLEADLNEEQARLQKSKISTSFHPVAVEVSNHKTKPIARVEGRLITLVGDTRVNRETITLIVQFEQDARGVLLLAGLNQSEGNK